MSEDDRVLAVIDAAMDQGFLDESYEMLWDHYGKKQYTGKKFNKWSDCKEFKKDCSNLWMAVQPTDGQLFLMAVKKHIIDHTIAEEGRNAGDWMPTAANLARHISYSIDERKAIKNLIDQEEKEKNKVPLGKYKSSIIKITDPLLKTAFKKDFIECIPNSASKCSTCGDTGRVPFYYYPDKPSHVFLQDEWFDLSNRSPEKAVLFQISTSVCDECNTGNSLYDKFSNNNLKHIPPSYWYIKKLAKKRKEKGIKLRKEKEILGASQQDLF